MYERVVVGQREVGFRQGDPASTINASLALEYTMDRVENKLREIVRDMRAEENWDEDDLHGGHLVGFADDGHVLTALGVAVKLAACLPEFYGKDRLEVVVKKSEIISQYANLVPENELHEGWGKATEGAIVLGVPIGKDEYIQAYLQNEIEKKKPPSNALDCLNKRLALHLTWSKSMCSVQSHLI